MRFQCSIVLTLLLLGTSSAAQVVPPANEARPFTSDDRLVVAYVFSWFTATAGQTEGVWHPLEGRSEWDGSVAFWKRQVKDMMDANVDLVYLHLLDTFSTERTNLYQALSELREEGFRVPQIAPWLDPAVTFFPTHLGPIDLCVAADRDLFMDQYEAFYQDYLAVDSGGAPFLATMDGKPMLNTWALSSNVANPQCLPRATFESELHSRLGSAFANGVYFASIVPPFGFGWADEFNRAFVGYTGAYYLVDGSVAVLKPGQWDHLDRFLARDSGSGYGAGWDDLLANSQVHQVQIESWNEYDESTGIFEADPTTTYWEEDGYLFHDDSWGATARHYLDVTAQKGASFNNVPERDAAILAVVGMPAAVDLGEALELQIAVRNTGDEQWRGDTGFALIVDWGNGFEASFAIDDGDYEIDEREDPLFTGEDGYGGVFRGRPIVFDIEVAAPTISGLYRPRLRMAMGGTPFGSELEQLVPVGDADACAVQIAPTTVYGTLGIGAYGSNHFCGDLGEPQSTADFICTWLGHTGVLDFTAAAKPPGSYCAYKLDANTPNYGLSGNFGHGNEVLSQVRCAPTSCGTTFLPTTVYATLGIGAYGNNCFAGDIGDPLRTADFICTQKGYASSIGYRTGPKTSSEYCAYKTEASSPNFGLLGNFGHGAEQLTEVRCI